MIFMTRSSDEFKPSVSRGYHFATYSSNSNSRYIYCKSIFYDGSSLEVNDRHHFTIRGMIHGGMQVVCMRADSVHELQ